MKKKILVVEDDFDSLNLIKDRIEALEYECITAMQPREGLQKAIEHQPQLVILDLMLPKMSGFGFLREFKNRKELKQIPVVVYSVINDAEIAQEAMNLGAKGYITKTCSQREFVHMVQECAA